MKPTYRPFYKRRGRPRGRVLAQIVLRTGLHRRFSDSYGQKLKKKLRRHRQFVDRLYQQLLDLKAAGNTKKAARVQRDIDALHDMDKALWQFRQFRDGDGEDVYENDPMAESFGFFDRSPRLSITKDTAEGSDRFGLKPGQGNVISGDKI